MNADKEKSQFGTKQVNSGYVIVKNDAAAGDAVALEAELKTG